MKCLWEILVPAAMDDFPVDASYHRAWDDKVRSITGGLTLLKATKGTWTNPSGVVFKEKMLPVRICCTETEIETIMDFTATHYNQEEVMAYRLSDCVKFRPNPS